MQSFKKILTFALGALAMIAVAVLGAFLSLRVAIHGREVEVPSLSGMSDSDAADTARNLGLNLSVENRFYSPAVGPNHVLSQSPVAGARVRRGWEVRVTESLGAQVVSVPDVTGQTERPASLVLRRSQLELGTVAHLPAPSPDGIVLAQSPPPNSKGINGPKVSLLVSDDEPDTAAEAFVMPSLTGLSLSAAALRLATAGLHIASVQSPTATPDAATPPDASDYVAPQAVTTAATITAQSPAAGHRITKADPIRIVLSH